MRIFLSYGIVLFGLLIMSSCLDQQEKNIPKPTEVYKNSKEGESSSARKAWIESMHRAAPGTDWRELELKTAMSRHAERNIKRSQVNLRSEWEDLIQDKYRGKWSERGSKNQAGSVFDTEFDPETEEIWLISAGGIIFKGSLSGQEWEPVNEDLRFSTGLLSLIPTSSGRNLIASINNSSFPVHNLLIFNG